MSSGEDIGVDMSGKVVEWVKVKAREWLVQAREAIKGVENRVEDRETVKARMDLVLVRWRELEHGFEQWVQGG